MITFQGEKRNDYAIKFELRLVNSYADDELNLYCYLVCKNFNNFNGSCFILNLNIKLKFVSSFF